MKDGQKLLAVGDLFFLLPEGFVGDMADALELLAKCYREEDTEMNIVFCEPEEEEIKETTIEEQREKIWDGFLDRIKAGSGVRFMGRMGLYKFREDVNEFEKSII